MHIISIVNYFCILKREGNVATIKYCNRKVALIITCPILLIDVSQQNNFSKWFSFELVDEWKKGGGDLA